MEQVKEILHSEQLKKIISMLENINIESIPKQLISIIMIIYFIEVAAIIIITLIRLSEKHSDIIDYVIKSLTIISYSIYMLLMLDLWGDISITSVIRIAILRFGLGFLLKGVENFIYFYSNQLIYSKKMSVRRYFKIIGRDSIILATIGFVAILLYFGIVSQINPIRAV